MNTAPFHSVKPYDPQIHHNDSRCKTGDNIQPENRRPGDGGRPLCGECKNIK